MSDELRKTSQTVGRKGGKRLAKSLREETETQRRRAARQTAEAAQIMPEGRTSRREAQAGRRAAPSAPAEPPVREEPVRTQAVRTEEPAPRKARPAGLLEKVKGAAARWRENEGADSPFLSLYRAALMHT